MRYNLALFLPSLRGGGAERVMVHLARGFAERGLKVDLVLAKAEGPYLKEVPDSVRVVDFNSSRVLWSLPKLVGYLRRERPKALLSALDHANIIALWARAIACVPTRVVVSVHNTTHLATAHGHNLRGRMTPFLIPLFYPWADKVVAVSEGVADDLMRFTGFARGRIQVIYNPVVTPELFVKTEELVNHLWFRPGEPPVIVGVGRLSEEKDFPTLLKAFTLVRRERPARLMILGEGEDRPKLEALIEELGLEEDVALPGFVDNPYKYMKRAAVLVLSSRWEGLPTVLIEALALGTPVVSNDCPSGPREVLEDGKWGMLVPVGAVEALAEAILKTLENPHVPKGARERMLERFSLRTAVDTYLEVLGIT